MPPDDDTNWDDVAAKYHQSKPLRWPSHYTADSYRKLVRRAVAFIASDTNEIDLLKTDVWEEGVETGIDVLTQLAGDRYRLHGIDISSVACTAAREHNGGIRVVQGDIRSLPFADASFDVVLDLSTLDHVTLGDARYAVAEYTRVLRQHGVLLLAFWCDTALLRLLLRLGGVRHRLLAIGGNQYYFPAKLVQGWLKEDSDIVEEFSIGSVLNFGFLVGISNTALVAVDRVLPKWLATVVVRLEHSPASKWLFSSFAGLRAIIAVKR
ncbi:MAG: class I SAM-dependent methyltransferase [Chloroflexota bacterium]|nr:class I SAM-dependent methyltransferase [Chloroflexota bacterium]